jgi:hypothetical protein
MFTVIKKSRTINSVEFAKDVLGVVKISDKSVRGVSGTIWIRNHSVEMACRSTQRYICGSLVKTLEIAGIQIYPRSKGTFSKIVLPVMEEIAKKNDRVMYIENVMEERFGKFFEKEGYSEAGENQPQCYFKKIT